MDFILEMHQVMLPEGQLTQYGLCLLADYYQKKYPALFTDRLFIVQTCADIALLSKQLPQNTVTAYIVNDEIHKTPIIQLNKQFIILDSKGNEATYWLEYAKQLKRVLGCDIKIYYCTAQRQMDLTSCGTDALVIIKQALRLGEKLFTFVAAQDTTQSTFGDGFRDQPVELAKYSQSVSSLWRQHPSQKKGLLDRVPQLAQYVFPRFKNNTLDNLTSYVERHREGDINCALVMRREKFRAILEAYLTEQNPQLTLSILMKFSGLSQMTRHLALDASTYDQVDFKRSIQDFLLNRVTLAEVVQQALCCQDAVRSSLSSSLRMNI